MANAYFYSNIAVQTTLTGSIDSAVTSCNVDSTAGWPTSYPFVIALDYGGASEELVRVDNNSAGTLTIVRAFGGTSAVSHSAAAVVRCVYNGVDATDFRTHEAATGAVHGVISTLVGTDDTQTLTNKTMTSPILTTATLSSGGSMSGTFTGTPTFNGAVTLSGTPSITNGATLNGTVAGAPTFSGAATFSDTPVFSGTPSVTGELDYTGATGATVMMTDKVTGDTQPRLAMQASGQLNWGSGSAATDTNLYRSAANTLKTDDSLVVAGNLTVTGDVTPGGVGNVIFLRKAADTNRTTATKSDDPDLTLTITAGQIYELSGALFVSTTDETNADFSSTLTVPASCGGYVNYWGQDTPISSPAGNPLLVASILTNPGTQTYGAVTTAHYGGGSSIILYGIIRPTVTGTFALNWARSAGAGTITLRADSFMRFTRLA